jgi:trans-2,3-dihydro-3-hydroxyanthranilate isomerase
MHIPFHLVDVFAERPLAGNPLAVVPHADGLDDGTMQSVARELKQAETTFLMRPGRESADWRLRSFTASGVEVFGAGHNSLGAWWWLAESGLLPLRDGQTAFAQEIGGRVLPVEIESSGQGVQSVTLTQAPPVFGTILRDLRAVAAALGLDHSDLTAGIPVQAVSTGASHLLVPLRNRSAVGRATPDVPALARVLADAGAQGCYLYSLDPVDPSATAHARFFNPGVGLFEDSATGSAAGPLACQLMACGITSESSPIAIEQGYEMGRPSLLRVQVRGDSVRLSGRCVKVANGTLYI